MTSAKHFSLSRGTAWTVGWAAFLALSLYGMATNGATRIHTWPAVIVNHLVQLTPFVLLALRREKMELALWPARAVAVSFLTVGVSVILARHVAFSFEVALLLWSGLAWATLVAVHTRAASLRSEPVGSGVVRWENLVLVLTLPLCASLYWGVAELLPGALKQGNGSDFRALFINYRNPHPFGHWNYTGGYALLVLPWLVVAFYFGSPARRIVIACGTTAAVAALLWTASRGAMIGAGLIVAAATVQRVALLREHRGRAIALLVVGVVVAVGILGLNPRLRDLALHPRHALVPSEGDIQRIGMLEAGWQLVQQRPWLGYGPGMTPFVYPDVRRGVLGGVETSYQLHNSALQVWVDHGVLGLLAMFILITTALAGGWHWMRTSDPAITPKLGAIGVASAYSLLGYTAMALTDYQLNVPWIVALLGLHLGVVFAGWTLKTSTRPVEIQGRKFPVILATFVVTALVMLLPDWRARSAFWAAWWNTPTTDTEGTARKLREAADAYPRNPYYRTSLGLYLANAVNGPTEPKGGAVYQAAAYAELTKSTAVEPLQEPVEAALGWLTLSANASEAEGHFQAALRLIPDRDTLHLGLAFARLSQGRKTPGIHALALECLVNPAFLASPVWYSGMGPMKPEVLAELEALYTKALDHPRTPEWRRRELLYARSWTRWWMWGKLPDDVELEGASAPQRVFFQSLRPGSPIPDKPELTLWPRMLKALEEARRGDTQAIATLAQTESLSEASIKSATARLARYKDSLGSVLRSPPVEAELTISQPISRLHYNIMFRNLDGPGYPDLAPRQTYVFINDFVSPLLPAKGLIPGPVFKDLE